MIWKKKQQNLQAMDGMMATSPHTIVLSFYPPSRCFTARRLTGTNGMIEEHLVLLEIVMPMSEKYYGMRTK
jgi:hypothetical protein